MGEPIRIEGWADVVGVATVADPEQLAGIDSKTIWTHEYAESRLKWKRRDPLWVLALRAYRLDDAIAVPWRDEYGGCTSWVDLADLPDDPAALPCEPALSDVAFKARFTGAAGELPTGFDEAPSGS